MGVNKFTNVRVEKFLVAPFALFQLQLHLEVLATGHQRFTEFDSHLSVCAGFFAPLFAYFVAVFFFNFLFLILTSACWTWRAGLDLVRGLAAGLSLLRLISGSERTPLAETNLPGGERGESSKRFGWE